MNKISEVKYFQKKYIGKKEKNSRLKPHQRILKQNNNKMWSKMRMFNLKNFTDFFKSLN